MAQGDRADRFDAFSTRYAAELATNPALDELRQAADEHRTVTLLYGAKDPEIDQAVVLADFMASASH